MKSLWIRSLLKLLTLSRELGAEVGEIANLGQKEFARVTDRRFPQAIFVQILFSAGADVPASLKEKFRLDRTIYRILIERV